MNVAVTANTAQFDRQMAKVRAKMKATRQGLSGGAGGALSAAGIGGGFGAGAGMMLRGSPLIAAIGGLTMALEGAKRQSEQGRKDIGEMAQLALSPQRQQEAKFGAQLIGGEDATATDLMAVQKAFDRRFLDRGKERELASLGIDENTLNKLNTSSVGQFTEDLIALAKAMNDMQRLAVAETLGGKAGEMFLRAGQFQGQGDVSNAIGQMSLESVARAMSEEQQRQQGMIDNAGGEGNVGFWAGLWDLMTGQANKTEEQLEVLNRIADSAQQQADAARLGNGLASI
jgi:hypothetical protein